MINLYVYSKKNKIVVTIFLILLSVLLFGCKAFSEKPVKTNVFDFTSYTTTLINNSTDANLSNETQNFFQTDAGNIEDFMLIRNVLIQFEDQQYIYNMNLVAKQKDQLTLNENFSSKSDFQDNLTSDVIVLTLTAFTDKESQKTYNLRVDTSLKTAYIENDTNIYQLDEDIYDQIIDSGLLIPVVDTTRIPQTLILNDQSVLVSQENSHWNQYVLEERYVQSDLNNSSINSLQTYTFDKPTELTLSWDKNPPAECQITFTPMAASSLNTEEKESSQITDSNTPAPSPIIIKITDQDPINFDLPLVQGDFLVEITSTWLPAQSLDFGTTTTYLHISNNYPEIITLQNSTIEPGDLIVIQGQYLDETNSYAIETNLVSRELSFIPYEDSAYLFVPLMSKYTPGEYYLNIKDQTSQKYLSKFTITVSEKEFQIQELSTSTATASLQNDANNKQLEEAFARARANPIQEKLWTGAFIQPAGGRISTEYGTIRYTNGAETGSRHSGIDFANPTGTVVKATQSGYVVLAEFLNITGNTLIIDHGLGFYSQYYHLDSIDVKLGDFVTVGDEVAKIGTTGFSTGPHLHFTIYYGGINLNPWKFFEKAPF